MRNVILAALAAALCGIGNASAADLSDGLQEGSLKDAVPYYAPVAGWSGAYVGVEGGIALLTEEFYDSEGDGCRYNGICPDGQGIGGLFGGTLGYNYQIQNLVLGFEGDVSWADISSKVTRDTTHYIKSHIDAIATARVRTGYALGTNLFYLTGGAAFLETRYEAIRNGAPCNTGESTCGGDRWHTGFAAGAGYEAMLAGNVSVKAEYMYVGTPTYALTNNIIPGDNEYNFIENVQVFRVGLNYKLDGTAPVAALSGGSMKDAPAYEVPGGWDGAYIGVAGGIGLLTTKFDDSLGRVCISQGICPDGQGVGGLIGGGLGYNWQFRNLVFGFEGDISWADLRAKVTTLYDRWNESRIGGIATLRARAGYATGANLFYVTGGGAFLDTQYKATDAEPGHGQNSATESGWRPGFAVGAGYEAMLTRNLNWKAEYLYIGDPSYSVTNPGSTGDRYGYTDDVQTFRIGLNYKLGSGGPIYAPLK